MYDRFPFIKVHTKDDDPIRPRRTLLVAIRFIRYVEISQDNQGSSIRLESETLYVKETPEELSRLIDGVN